MEYKGDADLVTACPKLVMVGTGPIGRLKKTRQNIVSNGSWASEHPWRC